MKHRFFNPELARMAAIAERYGSQQMYVDAQNLYSDAQALTVTAASTNIIDHGQDRNLGIGSPLDVVITVDVAAAGGGTLTVALQADDNSAFSSATSVATTAAIAAATLIAGYKFIIPVPPDLVMERFSRLNYTLATMTGITVTAFLTRRDMIDNAVYYASAVNPVT